MFYNVIYCLAAPIFYLFFRVRIYGRENIPPGAALVCVNHPNATDPIFVELALTRANRAYIMAKKQLLDLPVLGRFFHLLGVFAVDRGNADIGALKYALTLLRKRQKILIFPQGTRKQTIDPATAKTGVAMMAARTGAFLLPVYISPGPRPIFTKITIVFGKPYQLTLPEGVRPSAEFYQKASEDLMRRIQALSEQAAV